MFEITNIFLSVQVLVVIILFIIFYNFLRTKIKHMIVASKLPGPIALPILGNALTFLTIREETDLLNIITELFQKYGPIIRFWQGTELNIGINEPKYIEIILKSSKAQQKSSSYKYLETLFGKGLITGSGQIQRNHRLALQSTLKPFYFDDNGSFEKISNQCNLLVKNLESLANGQIFDIRYNVTFCVFSITNQVLLGIDNISSKNEYYLRIFESWQKTSIFATERMSNILYRSDFLFKFTKRYTEQAELIKIQDEYSEKILNQKVKLNLNMSLDKMLSTNDGLNKTECIKTINGLILVSQESSSTIVGFCLLMLAMNPKIQTKVYEEVIQIFDKNGDIEITLDKIASLNYLDLCFKETLRLFPTGPLIMRELIDDIKLDDDFVLPAKCVVAIFIYYLHRDPNIWPEPNKFIPERFTHEESVKRHPYSYIPFSGGQMSCVGKWFAGIVVKSIVASIIRKYHVETNYKCVEELQLQIAVSLRSKNGYPIRLFPRKAN